MTKQPVYIIKNFLQECSLGNIDNVKFLVERGENISKQALFEAFKNNHHELGRYLLSKKRFFMTLEEISLVSQSSKNNCFDVIKDFL